MLTSINKLRPVCLAFILAVAVQTGWSMVGGVIAEYGLVSAHRRRGTHTYERIEFSTEGVAIIVRSTQDYSQPGRNRTEYLSAKDRKPISKPRLLQMQAAELSPAAGYATHRWNRIIKPGDQGLRFAGELLDGRVVGEPRPTAYLVISDTDMTRGYFELFETESRERLGYVGRGGYRQDRPPHDDQFETVAQDQSQVIFRSSAVVWRGDVDQIASRRIAAYYDENFNVIHDDTSLLSRLSDDPGMPLQPGQCVLLSDGRAVLVDLVARTVTSACPDEGITSLAAVCPGTTDADGKYTLQIAARTPDKLLLLHPKTGGRRELPLPKELTSDGVSLQFLQDGTAILMQYERWPGYPIRDMVDSINVHVWWIAADGIKTIHDRLELQLDNDLANMTVPATNTITLVAGSPLATALIYGWVIPASESRLRGVGHLEMVGNMLRWSWPTVLVVLAIGFTCAWGVVRHRNVHNLALSWGWVAFAFLLGFPGYCGYLLHRRWPVTSPLPKPQTLGIEVFDSVAVGRMSLS